MIKFWVTSLQQIHMSKHLQLGHIICACDVACTCKYSVGTSVSAVQAALRTSREGSGHQGCFSQHAHSAARSMADVIAAQQFCVQLQHPASAIVPDLRL